VKLSQRAQKGKCRLTFPSEPVPTRIEWKHSSYLCIHDYMR
jgi:hypothetical protein